MIIRFRGTSLTGLVIGALAVSACGGQQSTAGDGTPGDPVNLTITWWGNTARAEATQKAIDLFRERHPEIVIEALPTSFDGYYNKLTTQFAASAAPDVFQDDQVRTFADKKLLLNLTDTGIDASEIDPNVLRQATVDGQVFEIPAGTSPMAFVHKADMLAEAGVDAPTAATSWDDLAETAAKVQESMPDGTWALADSSTQANHFEVFLRQRGAGWFSEDGSTLGFDEADLVDWWTYWNELRADGVTPAVDVSSAGSGGNVVDSPVAQDLVAMSIYGTAVSLPSEDWQYGPIPGEATNPGVYPMRSSSWAVNAASDHPEEAARLVDFLVNDPEAAALLGLSRGVPASRPALQAVREGASEKDQAILEYADYLAGDGNSGDAPAPEPAGMRSLRSDIFTRNAERVLFEQATPEEAAEATIAEAQALLASVQ